MAENRRERAEAESAMTDVRKNPRTTDGLDDQLNRAAEELITGDADDPPLSKEAVAEMLRTASNARRLKPA